MVEGKLDSRCVHHLRRYHQLYVCMCVHTCNVYTLCYVTTYVLYIHVFVRRGERRL